MPRRLIEKVRFSLETSFGAHFVDKFTENNERFYLHDFYDFAGEVVQIQVFFTPESGLHEQYRAL